MSDERHLGTDTLPPDRYLGPRRYLITCFCERCQTEYSWITEKFTNRNKPCPSAACVEFRAERAAAKASRNFAKIVEEQRAPGVIGSTVARAVDTTAEIVMQDHKMTDLRDNIREGDIVAPSLRPELQRQTDGFFNGQALNEAVGGGRLPGGMSRRLQIMGQRALRGGYRTMAADPGAIQKRQPGEAPLRYVGKEQLKPGEDRSPAGRDIGGSIG